MTNPNSIHLDIGCGLKKREGFTGIDISPDVNPDILLDVTAEPLPFDDSTVDEIYCAHMVEHLHDLIPFMNECYRVMKNSAKMTIIAPYYTAIQATQDPTHVRFINENSFLYFTDKYRDSHRTFEYGINAIFEIDSISYGYINVWAKKWLPRRIREWARKHLFNVAVDITVILKASKTY